MRVNHDPRFPGRQDADETTTLGTCRVATVVTSRSYKVMDGIYRIAVQGRNQPGRQITLRTHEKDHDQSSIGSFHEAPILHSHYQRQVFCVWGFRG